MSINWFDISRGSEGAGVSSVAFPRIYSTDGEEKWAQYIYMDDVVDERERRSRQKRISRIRQQHAEAASDGAVSIYPSQPEGMNDDEANL